MSIRRALQFVFPLPENLANSRTHWRKKHADKKTLWAMCDTLLACKRFPAPPRKPFQKARISSVMYLGNRMDTGNAMNRHKHLEDWLVTRGYLVDDSEKCLQWEGFPEQIIDRKDPRIEVTLTEAA